MMLGPSPPGQLSARSVHHQYSSSVSPFQAKQAALSRATAAAAWSCVLKMLQEHQRTVAPSLTSVSMSTAVWMVMCKLPVIRAPFSGCFGPNSSTHAMRPGISTSASWISMRLRRASGREASLMNLGLPAAAPAPRSARSRARRAAASGDGCAPEVSLRHVADLRQGGQVSRCQAR